jgi:hypothetical protein
MKSYNEVTGLCDDMESFRSSLWLLTPEEGNECLPCFARDAQFGYNGTTEGLTGFLLGWQGAIKYLTFIKATSAKVIEIKEDLYRQEATIKRLKGDKGV